MSVCVDFGSFGQRKNTREAVTAVGVLADVDFTVAWLEA